MVSITFPCGCKINAAFTLAMCAHHYHDLKRQEEEAERDFRKFEELMRSPQPGSGQES